MQSITVYGIANCDTVKKARAWLDEHQAVYTFVDFKKTGVPTDRLGAWANALGWGMLINRRGTTWRKLDGAMQAGANTSIGAQKLALTMPSVIKRPVVEWADIKITAGFDAAQFLEALRSVIALKPMVLNQNSPNQS